ncbi:MULTISPECIES: prepilin peptidase [Arthrobacter]|uniref:A24 family peptidase n=1 Tax=Arthrobacter caoxuetaonis TaxID=2886935 RepID=A0A9X1ME56_9MICC|nr:MULTISPECIES: A24 family peptidase [Arthrobacter]MCC3282305.1 A24 family peptidase [Arthrobacter caoxuetaonis]MCC3297307.1 A24 family peptidase [Arthrobacter caoxuetaonis]MCC9194196.1 A24 family peptidase [Arthrobacter sp. zg-Y916]USQ58143.1 A24 family peptidase [Arthrobacter caoxuetaonis]
MWGIVGEYWVRNSFAAWLLLAALGYFVVLSLRLAGEDLRTRRLPNRLVLPAYPASSLLLGAAALAAGEPGRLAGMAFGAAALLAGYFLLRLISPGGLGLGDVKLAGVLGLFLGYAGWGHVLAGAAAGFVLGGIWGLGLVLSGRGTGKTRIAFGPFMLAGAALVLAAPGLQ